ncbi:oligopeptide ABC transporter permease [Thermicanus aegyptius]|uniref:oligopeptide ABC transporter permease n=1 Tax=Thermicanus aegyptius TaxID=94009 RepID=UPI00040F43B6|nr:oligopeptide ABC transporter permease [Thermicanus aegyptius]
MIQTVTRISLQKEIKPTRSESPWRTAFRRLVKNKLAMAGFFILLFMFLFSFVGPYFSPYKEAKITIRDANQPPSAVHWLGTDNLGRDVLLRVMEAGQISLTVGLVATLLVVIIGGLVGAVSGYYGRWVDVILMRFVDIMYAIPTLPILILLGAILSDLKFPPEQRIYVVMFMLGALGWMGVARLVRSQILSLKEQEFMIANEVLGIRDRRKIFRHLLPNTVPIIIVTATLSVAGSILTESALSYLGLGVIPPTPSWGQMLSVANNLIDFQKRPWLWIPPGVSILVTVVAINFIGDGLRDALDPKQKR